MSVPHDDLDDGCQCDECRLNTQVAVYLIYMMDPTDRAVRPAGNIYPAEGYMIYPSEVPS
jgi:hypothetical protein